MFKGSSVGVQMLSASVVTSFMASFMSTSTAASRPKGAGCIWRGAHTGLMVQVPPAPRRSGLLGRTVGARPGPAAHVGSGRGTVTELLAVCLGRGAWSP